MSEEQILDTDVFKAVIARGSSLVMMDVIQYQGLFWLVPEWLDFARRGMVEAKTNNMPINSATSGPS
jgi:hypothetical protein